MLIITTNSIQFLHAYSSHQIGLACLHQALQYPNQSCHMPADPYSFEQVADQLQRHWQATAQAQPLTSVQQSPAGSASDPLASTSNPELFPSTPSALGQSLVPHRQSGNAPALEAFSQAGIARQYEQV